MYAHTTLLPSKQIRQHDLFPAVHMAELLSAASKSSPCQSTHCWRISDMANISWIWTNINHSPSLSTTIITWVLSAITISNIRWAVTGTSGNHCLSPLSSPLSVDYWAATRNHGDWASECSEALDTPEKVDACSPPRHVGNLSPLIRLLYPMLAGPWSWTMYPRPPSLKVHRCSWAFSAIGGMFGNHCHVICHWSAVARD